MPVTTRVDVELLTNPRGQLKVPHDPRFEEILKRLYRTRLSGGRAGTFTAVLMPEAAVEGDPNPVAVIAAGPGKIGTLAPEDAERWHELLADFKARTGKHVACNARLVGKHVDDPSLHAVLEVVPEDVAEFEPEES